MGALDVQRVVHQRQGWRLISCMWLHAGVFHVLANMLSLVFIGIRLEQEFGLVRIGFLYLMSGFGGSLLSALFIQYGISELISNWTMYEIAFATYFVSTLDVDDRAQLVAAVKVFNLLRHGAAKCFISGCEALRNIKHRNLVKIITACSSVDSLGNDFKALVYEYMEKGSLEKWLHPPTDIEEAREAAKSLNLLQRLSISIYVACALD